MIRSLAFIAVLVGCVPISFTQESKEQHIQHSRRHGVMWFYTGLRPAKPGKAVKYDRLVFDVTYNDWQGDLSPFRNRWTSIGLNTNLLFDIQMNSTQTISFGTGVRHSLFRTENSSNLFTSDPTKTYTMITPGIADAKRILLCGNSIGIPLELRFRTKGSEHFKFQVGVTPSFQLNIYSKTIYNSNLDNQVVKAYDFVDLNRFSLSTHVRFGTRNWAVFGSYGINPLFYKRASTELHLIQLGLSVSLF